MLLLDRVPGLSEWGVVLLAYLLGSVPFGLLLGLVIGKVDIRTVGSGNIGATNVGRALGRPYALLAFALDFFKGWLPGFWVLAVRPESHLVAVLCGGAAVCGHVWPIYLRFRGGKGVATGCGALVGVDPVIFLLGGLVWPATLLVTRFVGLSSMLMGLSFPLIAWWRVRAGGVAYGFEVVWGAAALALLIFVRHRANMKRMLAGTEPRVGRDPRGGKG